MAFRCQSSSKSKNIEKAAQPENMRSKMPSKQCYNDNIRDTFRRVKMRLGPTELIIIFAIVLLLFGVGRLSKIGGELGRGIREFRTGLKGDEEEPAASEKETPSKGDAALQFAARLASTTVKCRLSLYLLDILA